MVGFCFVGAGSKTAPTGLNEGFVHIRGQGKGKMWKTLDKSCCIWDTVTVFEPGVLKRIVMEPGQSSFGLRASLETGRPSVFEKETESRPCGVPTVVIVRF